MIVAEPKVDARRSGRLAANVTSVNQRDRDQAEDPPPPSVCAGSRGAHEPSIGHSVTSPLPGVTTPTCPTHNSNRRPRQFESELAFNINLASVLTPAGKEPAPSHISAPHESDGCSPSLAVREAAELTPALKVSSSPATGGMGEEVEGAGTPQVESASAPCTSSASLECECECIIRKPGGSGLFPSRSLEGLRAEDERLRAPGRNLISVKITTRLKSIPGIDMTLISAVG